MIRGRVYCWESDPGPHCGGVIHERVVPLPRLAGEGRALEGRYLQVHNAGSVMTVEGGLRPLRDAEADTSGDFLFDPGWGGGRMDKRVDLGHRSGELPGPLPSERYIRRYEQAAHFGEVNAYFHVDKIAAYLDELLRSLGAASLPRVT